MEFDQYMTENSCEYKGYKIGLGYIRKDGDLKFMFFHPLCSPKEDAFSAGKAIIDEHEAEDAKATGQAS